MAAIKKEKAAGNKPGRKKNAPLVAAAVVMACAALVLFVSRNQPEKQETAALSSEAPTAIAQGEALVIPISDISEEAAFYPFTVDGEDMEVFAVKASDGTIRTAFNTCQSCYTSGAGFYRFENGELICNNCGFHFSPDEVEVASGGCNPWPIFAENKTVSDDSISIPYEFLSASKKIFANWKTAVN